MRPRKNRKRIDPRYFLSETTDIDNDGDNDIEDVKAVVDVAVGGSTEGIPGEGELKGVYKFKPYILVTEFKESMYGGPTDQDQMGDSVANVEVTPDMFKKVEMKKFLPNDPPRFKSELSEKGEDYLRKVVNYNPSKHTWKFIDEPYEYGTRNTQYRGGDEKHYSIPTISLGDEQ